VDIIEYPLVKFLFGKISTNEAEDGGGKRDGRRDKLHGDFRNSEFRNLS
jgi:hypothetical protein